MTEMMVFALLGVAVTVYALTAGADFGGGVWDLFASGPRREAQRELIADAIAPIWEVNHIWMIFVVVVLFTVFPLGFAVVSTALHIPLLLVLVGIVLRGSAFVFRAYGMQPNEVRARWGRVFAWASVITPVFLGMVLAALSSGHIAVDLETEQVTSGFFAGWLDGLAIATGLFALVLFALLAAVYLAREAELRGEAELSGDFRRRALVCEAIAFVLAAIVLWRAYVETHVGVPPDTPTLYRGLLHAPWSIPAQVATAVAAGVALVALIRDKVALARVAVMVQITLIVLGWGLAMDGHLLLPNLHVLDAGAEPIVLRSLPPVLIGGTLVFAPALWWLFRVFHKLD